MALTRSSPLLTTIAELVDLVGIQGLAALEQAAEFSVADTLLAAHQWLFDRLKRRFSTTQLLTLTNTVELHRAVAYRFVEIAAAAGYLRLPADRGGPDYWAAQAREEVDGFQPEWSDDADAPRRADEGIPRVKNLTSRSRGALFGGELT